MNDYRELRIDIEPCSEDGTDIMAYLLGEAGFESFVPDNRGLTAYIKAEDFDSLRVNDALAAYPFAAALNVSSRLIEGKDWNEEWEKNYFQPIVIGDRCVVHSTFHTDIPIAQYDITIDPKMAFGTGHHATTSQVATVLLDSDLAGKSIIDVGTGTGILAILAAMRGASVVTGIEIDGFAYENAVENMALNGVENVVSLIHGDASALVRCQKADILVANINRNIILQDLELYAAAIKDDGKIVLSGFYEADIPVILERARALGLDENRHSVLNDWACLILNNNRASEK